MENEKRVSFSKQRTHETVKFSVASLTKNSIGADGVMVSYHIVKDGKVTHYFEATDFPMGDWGLSMIAMGVEAKAAELRILSSRSER